MKIRHYIFLSSALFLLLVSSLHGQRGEDQQWFSVGISQDVKDYRWSVEQNLRARYGLSIMENSFTSFGLRRKLTKRIAVSADYRLGWKSPRVEPGIYHRFNLDARFRKKWKKQDLQLDWRPRIQVRFKPDEGRVDQTWYLRNKLTLSKKLNKTFNIWLGGELFTQLNEERQGLNNDEVRGFLGLDIDVGKRKELSVFYIWSEEFNRTDPYRSHILGLGFSYSLKKWKKRKKKKSDN